MDVRVVTGNMQPGIGARGDCVPIVSMFVGNAHDGTLVGLPGRHNRSAVSKIWFMA